MLAAALEPQNQSSYQTLIKKANKLIYQTGAVYDVGLLKSTQGKET